MCSYRVFSLTNALSHRVHWNDPFVCVCLALCISHANSESLMKSHLVHAYGSPVLWTRLCLMSVDLVGKSAPQSLHIRRRMGASFGFRDRLIGCGGGNSRVGGCALAKCWLISLRLLKNWPQVSHWFRYLESVWVAEWGFRCGILTLVGFIGTAAGISVGWFFVCFNLFATLTQALHPRSLSIRKQNAANNGTIDHVYDSYCRCRRTSESWMAATSGWSSDALLRHALTSSWASISSQIRVCCRWMWSDSLFAVASMHSASRNITLFLPLCSPHSNWFALTWGHFVTLKKKKNVFSQDVVAAIKWIYKFASKVTIDDCLLWQFFLRAAWTEWSWLGEQRC